MINEQTVKLKVASTSVEYSRWGEITGNIENQNDLMNLLGERDLEEVQETITQGLSDIDTAKEEAIEEIRQSGGGFTADVKNAILNCFSHVAWIDENGQTYYDALYDALYGVPAPTLTSISAVYTQSGTVYTTDTLDSLKSDLVVTATYDDSSTATVPSADYTLSGTLTEGTSTITVSYSNQTTTFTVTVSPAPTPQVVTAINLPYGAYIDTEYVPTSVNHKYQLGVQLLSSEAPAANVWFAGMNRLPQSTTGAEEYWHIYFGTGNQSNSKNDTFIQWNIGAYQKGLTSGNLRTSDSTSNKGSLITQTPYYIRIANGLQQIRANEAMTEILTSGDFAYMGSQTAYNAVTAENPIDSFFIGKLNQKGLRTVTEYQGGVKIFCFRVFDENDTLLVDMHPAVLGADVGMYDSVRNEFYTASGTGATYDE